MQVEQIITDPKYEITLNEAQALGLLRVLVCVRDDEIRSRMNPDYTREGIVDAIETKNELFDQLNTALLGV